MGRIYRDARATIVWLGWSDGLDLRVTSTLRKEISSDSSFGPHAYSDLLLNGASSSSQIRVKRGEATPQAVCHFVWQICKKVYWTRRWIVQKILLARRVLLVFREQELPWSAICIMFQGYEQNQGEPNPYCQAMSGSTSSILTSTAARIWRHQTHIRDDHKV